MLDTHSAVAVPPESYFVVPLLRQRDTLGSGPDAIELASERIRQAPSFQEWRLPREELDRVAGRAESLPHLLLGLYEAYASHHGKSRPMDKTPYHVRHINTIAANLPARFVHLIRDGRDTALSLSKAPFGPDSFPRAIRYWREHVSAGRRAGSGLPHDQYYELRYEELVADPAGELLRLCDWLGLAFETRMLSYQRRGVELIADLRSSQHLTGITEPIQEDRSRWREVLTADQLALADHLAGDLLSDLGYEAAGDGAGVNIALRGSFVEVQARASGRYKRLRNRTVRRLRARGGRPW